MAAASSADGLVPCEPGDAFALLADPRSLAWLLGPGQRLHAFGPSWPAPGSVARFSVGVGLVAVTDRVQVTEVETARSMALEARVTGLGTLAIRFELAPADGGTRVAIVEIPQGGRAAAPGVGPVLVRIIRRRDGALLRRFARLAARRAEQRAALPPPGSVVVLRGAPTDPRSGNTAGHA